METERLKSGQRALWLAGEDSHLLGQCEVDTYRASGPGGQKRNKTSSAVRLRHKLSGLIVISEDSRSQHENKARALKRLRREICLSLREEPGDPQVPIPAPFGPFLASDGITISSKNPAFFPLAGWLLDGLFLHQGRVSDLAQTLGMNTAQVVAFFQSDSHVWQEANRIRKQMGHPPLR